MKRFGLLVVTAMVTLSCASSDGVHQDIGEATITESKADVRRCEYVTRVSAEVDVRLHDGDRAAATQALLEQLRNNTLHQRCDTVYLVRVDETATRLIAVGEGYRCKVDGIGRKPKGVTGP